MRQILDRIFDRLSQESAGCTRWITRAGAFLIDPLRQHAKTGCRHKKGAPIMGLVSAFFKSPVFTWWNSPSFGTRLFTRRQGVSVGVDDYGNTYYTDKARKRRWVIFAEGPVEASRVPPEWHAWLHKTVDLTPLEQPPVVKTWEKPHVPNLTGSAGAYLPGGSLSSDDTRTKTAADYEAWSPET